MRRGYRLQTLGYSLIFFLLLPVAYSLSSVYAAESTPSADIKAKLEELKKEIASKAAKLKQEINRKLKDKAYTGKVKSKSETTLTLAAESGPKVININQDTVFESNIKSKQKFSQKTISLEDRIAALGDSDETGVLTARKIILLPPTAYNLQPKTYLWGQIVSISDQLTTLKNSESKNISLRLPAQAEVKSGDFVILTGINDKNNVFSAKFVYVISQGNIKAKKTASPSAKVSTPSSKPVTTKANQTTPKPTSR